jgi:hypothetical protein
MSVPPQTMYLEPTDENARRLFQRGIEGPLLMLNLRFREIADYIGSPDLAPPEPISGSAAYDRYVRHTLPFLAASGGSVEFYGTGGHTFVGPRGRLGRGDRHQRRSRPGRRPHGSTATP